MSRVPKTLRWIKGSQELEADDKFKMHQEGKVFSLVVKAAGYEDEAKYIFEAEDKRTSGKLIIQGTHFILFKIHRQMTMSFVSNT